MPASRSKSSGRSNELKTIVPNKVDRLKLRTKPATTPYGRHDFTLTRRVRGLTGRT